MAKMHKGDLYIQRNLRGRSFTVDVQAVVVSAVPIALSFSSPSQFKFSGSAADQIVVLGDATDRYANGHFYLFHNMSTKTVTIKTFTGTALLALAAGATAQLILMDNGTQDGTWSFSSTATLQMKAGIVPGAGFSGSPKKATITFVTPYGPGTVYAVNISAKVARTWTYENETVSGFVINANAAAGFVGDVSWETVATGEA